MGRTVTLNPLNALTFAGAAVTRAPVRFTLPFNVYSRLIAPAPPPVPDPNNFGQMDNPPPLPSRVTDPRDRVLGIPLRPTPETQRDAPWVVRHLIYRPGSYIVGIFTNEPDDPGQGKAREKVFSLPLEYLLPGRYVKVLVQVFSGEVPGDDRPAGVTSGATQQRGLDEIDRDRVAERERRARERAVPGAGPVPKGSTQPPLVRPHAGPAIRNGERAEERGLALIHEIADP